MSKTIGIVGGMSPESTTMYYEVITRTYQDRFGDYGFPEIIIFSVSFQKYVNWMHRNAWDKIANGLIEAIVRLKNGGAHFAIIATNTMHKVFDQIQKESPLPLLSIIDATAEAIQSKKMKTIGLLGTRFTMAESFYKERLGEWGIKTLVPDDQGQKIVNQIVFDELGKGKIRKESKQKCLTIVQRLHQRGVQGVILGCTELPLLIQEKDCGIPLFNTAVLHAEKVLQYSLS